MVVEAALIKESAEQRLGSSLTINDQSVENRRQLVGAKAPRRSTEASPQSTGCLPADALRQRQAESGWQRGKGGVD